MHQDFPHLFPDQMPFQLRGVVGHVVDHFHPQVAGIAMEDLGEDFADAVEDHLAVGEGHVHRAFHGRRNSPVPPGNETARRPVRDRLILMPYLRSITFRNVCR